MSPVLFTQNASVTLLVTKHVALSLIRSSSQPYQLSVLEFSSILTLSAWSSHQIPRVSGAVPQGCSLPAPLQSQPKSQAVTCTSDRLAINQGSHNPLIVFQPLLEWLTELKETHLLVHYKGYSENTGERTAEDAQGKACGKGPSDLPASQPLHWFTNPEVFQTPRFGGFTENSSHRHGQSLTQCPAPLPSPEDGDDGLKVPSFSSGPTESHLVRTKDSRHLGSSKGFRISASGAKTRYQKKRRS